MLYASDTEKILDKFSNNKYFMITKNVDILTKDIVDCLCDLNCTHLTILACSLESRDVFENIYKLNNTLDLSLIHI